MPYRNLLAVLTLAIVLTSCHKSHSNLIQSKIQVGYFDDSTLMEMATSSSVVRYAWGKPGDAVLQANKLTGMLCDTNGTLVPIDRISAEAIFCNGASWYSTFAGNLLLNGASVGWLSNGSNHYNSYNNALVWNDTGTNQWQIAGSSNFPAANVSMDGSFPEFTGVLPDSVSPLNYTLTFNSSNTSNADSAKLFLYAGDMQDSLQNPPFITTVLSWGQSIDATNGVADAGARPGIHYVNYHYDMRGKRYYTGLLVVLLLKETQQTINGKVFTLARQRVIYKSVIIK